MPSFGDMLEVVDLLHLKAISICEDRCVAVRNRNSKCRKCADACIADAVTVSHNEVVIAADACVNCGCCIAVCPTGALEAVEPSREALLKTACGAGDASSGTVVFACARKAARREGDPEKYAEVPCLGHLTEGELLDVVAAGYDDVVLVDGDCASCKFGAASPCIDDVVATAGKLLDACGSEAIVTRTSEFPPEVVDRESAQVRGKSRRGIMRQTGSYVKTVAGNVAQKAIDEKLGRKSEPLTLRDRLGAGKSGKIPTFSPSANYRLLEDMEQLGAAAEGGTPEGVPASCDGGCPSPWGGAAVDTRHFGVVEVNPDACSGCGMCVMFCPTGALKFDDFDEAENPDRRFLEFQAADCTQCMLCKDVCLRYCLEVSPKVALSELYDFEPRLVEIAKPQHTSGLTAFRLRNGK